MNYPNVKLVMKSSDTNGKSISTTVGYVNPNATDEVLNEFAQKLNAFTTNALLGITKVTTDDITDEEGGGFPYTLQVTPTSHTFSEGSTEVTLGFSTNIPTDYTGTISASVGYGEGSASATSTTPQYNVANQTGTWRITSNLINKGTRELTLTIKEGGEAITNTVTVTFTVE